MTSASSGPWQAFCDAALVGTGAGCRNQGFPSCVAQDQFFDFASTMVNTGPDAFFARIGRSALVNTMVLPGASYGLKRVRLPCPHMTGFIFWIAALAGVCSDCSETRQ